MGKYLDILTNLWALLCEDEPETQEEVDAYLRAAGYEPDELVARLRAKLRPMLDEAQKRLTGEP